MDNSNNTTGCGCALIAIPIFSWFLFSVDLMGPTTFTVIMSVGGIILLAFALQYFSKPDPSVDFKWPERLIIPDSNLMTPRYLVVDIETNGLPLSNYGDITKSEHWPDITQIAWILLDRHGEIVSKKDFYIKYKHISIPHKVQKMNGITPRILKEEGTKIKDVMNEFRNDAMQVDYIVAHNISFDLNIIMSKWHILGMNWKELSTKNFVDTMEWGKYADAYRKKHGSKRPKLTELGETLINLKKSETDKGAHNARFDVYLTALVFNKLDDQGHFDFLHYDELLESPTKVDSIRLKFHLIEKVSKKEVCGLFYDIEKIRENPDRVLGQIKLINKDGKVLTSSCLSSVKETLNAVGLMEKNPNYKWEYLRRKYEHVFIQIIF